MPYKVRARKCKQSDKTGGRHVVLKLKRGGGTKQVSCHTTKQLAKSAVRARYASEIGESIMKITAGKLRQIIREEIERIQTPEQLSEQASSEQELFDKYWSEGNPLITKFIGKKGATHGPDARAKDVSGARRAVAKRRLAALTTANMEKIARLIRDQEGEQRRKAITKIFKSL